MPRSSQACTDALFGKEGSAAGAQAEAGQSEGGQAEGVRHMPGHRRGLQLLLYQWDLPPKVVQVQLPEQGKVVQQKQTY